MGFADHTLRRCWPVLALVGATGAAASSSDYHASGSIFEQRTEFAHDIGTLFQAGSGLELQSRARQSGSRDSSNRYSSDQFSLALEVERSIRSWLRIDGSLDASRAQFSRNSSVEQDAQEFELSTRIDTPGAFSIDHTIGAFWFRTEDLDSEGVTTQVNRGLENRLDLSGAGAVRNAQLNGSLGVTNQLQAAFPGSAIGASGALRYPGRELVVDVDLSADQIRDFPVSEVLDGFEKRVTKRRRISSSISQDAFSDRLTTTVQLDIHRHGRSYLEQPHKNREEDDDALVAELNYHASDSSGVTFAVERGFYRELAGLLGGGKLDRRVEKRGVRLSAHWRKWDWLGVEVEGARTLHRTDHHADADGADGDDGDDLGDLFELGLELHPAERVGIDASFTLDRLQERHLRADWAAFSLDRSAYTLRSSLSYEPVDSLSLVLGTTLLSTLTDYIYDSDASNFLLDRRISSALVWSASPVAAHVEARLHFRTIGGLVRSSSGEAQIQPTREELVSSIDVGADGRIGDWARFGIGWVWRESAAQGREPNSIHDLSLDLGLTLSETRTWDLGVEERIRPDDELHPLQTVVVMGLSVDF